MIYIDNNSKRVNFPRVGKVATELICTNQTSKIDIVLPVVDSTGKYYVVDFTDYIQRFENGQYDYIFRDDNDEYITSGLLQFGDYNSSNTQYKINIDFIQYTPR